MIPQIATFAILATSAAATNFPPLSREGRVGDRFWGLELLGSVAVWHSPGERQTMPISRTLPLPGPDKRALFVIEDEGGLHSSVATETGCLRNDLGFPVRLNVLSPDNAVHASRLACCTAAE